LGKFRRQLSCALLPFFPCQVIGADAAMPEGAPRGGKDLEHKREGFALFLCSLGCFSGHDPQNPGLGHQARTSERSTRHALTKRASIHSLPPRKNQKPKSACSGDVAVFSYSLLRHFASDRNSLLRLAQV